jgi:hypothetical protein
LRRRTLKVNRQAHLPRQHIRGSAGQNRERHVTAQHPVRNFVDRAVAARRHNQIAATLYFVPRLLARRPWRFGRNQCSRDPLPVQHSDGTLKQMAPPR